MAYNLETVLAEKIETVLSRSIANTRPRDFYDIHIIFALRGNECDKNILKRALERTSTKRGSNKVMENYRDIMRIAGAQSAEQSGIRGVKRPFDPNIISLRRSEAICRCRTYGRNIKKIMIMQRILLLKILVILLNISWITLWQGKEYIRKILNL